MDPTTSEIGVRDAADADLPAMAAILNQEIAASPFVYAEESVTLDERRAWLDEHRAAGLPVFVAAEGSAVLGWASLSPYRASSGYRFTAEPSVYVAHAARRRGVGAVLLDALVEAPAARQFHAFVASIDAENAPSIALFERFGFSEAARPSALTSVSGEEPTSDRPSSSSRNRYGEGFTLRRER